MRPRGSRSRGVFITFEGIEGSGKSTQCAALARCLRDHGYPVVQTREPGGSPMAERIRQVLLRENPTGPSREPVAALTEALLVLAARCQHLAQTVTPALRRGAVVLCDRFTDSTLAYQGYGRGLDVHQLARINRFVTGGLTPDLTLLFDCPVTVGLTRRRGERDQNRLDREATQFYRRVRRGFLLLAARDTRRVRVLDGRQDPDTLAAAVERLVWPLLQRRLRRPLVP